MKRIQIQSVDAQKDVPKKRKIQTIFLGALGDDVTNQSSILNRPSMVTDSNQCFTEKISTLHVNPLLIDRVISDEQQLINEQHREIPLPVKAENMNEIEFLDEHSVLSNSSLLLTTENIDKPHQQDDQRSLPELQLQSSTKLTPFPKAVELFNVVDVDLPIPASQKALEVAIPMGAIKEIDQLFIKNLPKSKRGIKYAKIEAKFGRELKWIQILSSPLLLIQANTNWVVSTHEDNSLTVFCTTTGRICFTLHTYSPITDLELRGDICMALSTVAELTTWDLKKSYRILHTSLRTLLSGSRLVKLKIVRLCLSANGLPILILNNGDMAVYSRSLSSWLFLNINRDFLHAHLPSMLSIAQLLPDGLISLAIDVFNKEKFEYPSTNSIHSGEEMQPLNDESQLELLLRATIELESIEEYRLLVAIYMQKLVKNGRLDKMTEFLEELRANSNVPLMFIDTILADIWPLLQSHGISNALLLSSKNNEQRRERELDATLNFILS